MMFAQCQRTQMRITCVAVIVLCSSVGQAKDAASSPRSGEPLQRLRAWLEQPPAERSELSSDSFAAAELSEQDVDVARKLLFQDRLVRIRDERQVEWEAGVLQQGDKRMPFVVRKFGERPSTGWSVFLSLHGGGGAPARVNDQQWENQKRLYQLQEGLYVVPRAPTDTWNLWHQSHIDLLFARLIENLVAFEGADPNRVYVMGYSAGGDGVYQLAPRMCDRWAAAAMMAGHPNDASPLGLRNVPFALQVGGNDAAYRRNQVGQEWGERLKQLHQQDPNGYEYLVKIYPGKGHWMDLEDAVAIPWMAQHRRQPTPDRVVWKQDDVTTSHCYWLSVDPADEHAGSEVVAETFMNRIQMTGVGVERITVHLDDRFIDLNQPVTIVSGETTLFSGRVKRTIANLADSLQRSGDVELAFPAAVSLSFPQPIADSQPTRSNE